MQQLRANMEVLHSSLPSVDDNIQLENFEQSEVSYLDWPERPTAYHTGKTPAGAIPCPALYEDERLFRWRGEILREDRHHEIYDDGSTYEGQLVESKRHGHGTWQSAFESYEGQWREDQRDGEGTQTWEDARLYHGQFKAGKFHGLGRMEWHTTQGLVVYEGHYFNDLKHGIGRYCWPDGRIYDGEWSQGTRCGKAAYVSSRGDRRMGIWSDDKLDRWLVLEDGSAAPQAAGGYAAAGF